MNDAVEETVPAKPTSPAVADASPVIATLRVGPMARERRGEPVRVGVPLPFASAVEAESLELLDRNQQAVVADRRVLARWHDGSIRWLELEFLADVDAASQSVWELRSRPESPEKRHGDVAESGAARVPERIETRTATFDLSPKTAAPLRSVRTHEAKRDLIAACRWKLVDAEGHAWSPSVRESRLETLPGDRVRQTISHGCSFIREAENGTGSECPCELDVRTTFYLQSALVRCEVTLRNPRAASHPGGLWDLGDEGSFLFRELSLECELDAAGETNLLLQATPEHSLDEVAGGELEVYQDSSGGENWQSRNHVDRDGKLSPRFRGARIRTDSGECSERRSNPRVQVRTPAGTLTIAVPRFWQEFPKALEVHEGRLLRVGLFPRQHEGLFELQGGEQKTHTIWLAVQGADERALPAEESTDNENCGALDWVHRPLRATLSPEEFAASGAFPYLVPEANDPHADYVRQVRRVIEGPDALEAKREVIDEYGWRNFGDLWADHERRYYEGSEPIISHYNNQYDGLWGFLYHFARSGDPRWMDLADDLARHIVDIDLYHTDQDRAAYNGGLFWHTDHYTDAGRATHRAYSKDSPQARAGQPYGGGPSCEHSYSTGLLYHWLMTGEPRSRDAVLSLARWVIRIDDGRNNILGNLDSGPTGLASATYSPDYHGPGRGAGNSINTLVDAYSLSGDRTFLDKAEELIRRSIHPQDDCGALGLADAESRWSYLVFLQSLGKYLDLKLERGDTDDTFEYARASLLAYARWMTENETPYKTRLEGVEFPTETWPAHDLRKSCAFDFASRYATADERDVFLERAEFFHRQGIEDVLSFETSSYTRPLIIFLTCGAQRAAFRLKPPQDELPTRAGVDFGEPSGFVSQKLRVKQLIKTPRGMLRLAGACFKPDFLRRLITRRLS